MAKRRPSGDGMVRLKKENQWEGRIVVGHKQNGDSIFRYAYGKTQKEMMQKLNVLKLQYQDANLNEDSNITLSEWLDKWITELMPQAVRPTTLKGFELICRCYIKPYLGDKKIAFITTNDVQKMYAKLKKEGRIKNHPVHGHTLADNMIIKIHSTLHLAMETAIAKNLIAKNPTEGTTVPNKEKDFVQTLNYLMLFLSYFHLFPTNKTIYIVKKKCNKTHDNRNISDIKNTCQYPQNYKHNIICSIGKCKVWTSSKCKIHCDKTCCNGDCTWNNICGVEVLQYKVKDNCNDNSDYPHKNIFS